MVHFRTLLTHWRTSLAFGKLWAHLQNPHAPQYLLLSAIRALYKESAYILIGRDKVSEEIMATQGVKQGCPLSPLLYLREQKSLSTNDLT